MKIIGYRILDARERTPSCTVGGKNIMILVNCPRFFSLVIDKIEIYFKRWVDERGVHMEPFHY